jgi:hypothetical protein
MGGMRFTHGHIEWVIERNRAHFGALTATVTGIHIYETGLGADGRSEITSFAVEFDNFTIGG